MKTLTRSLVPLAVLAMAADPVVMAGAASAVDGGTTNLVANLTQLNSSGA